VLLWDGWTPYFLGPLVVGLVGCTVGAVLVFFGGLRRAADDTGPDPARR
jgi:hypothetical protein